MKLDDGERNVSLGGYQQSAINPSLLSPAEFTLPSSLVSPCQFGIPSFPHDLRLVSALRCLDGQVLHRVKFELFSATSLVANNGQEKSISGLSEKPSKSTSASKRLSLSFLLGCRTARYKRVAGVGRRLNSLFKNNNKKKRHRLIQVRDK